MSDEERDYSAAAGEEEEEETAANDEGPSEAELAMQKRRQVSTADMDESAADLLEENKIERKKMEAEIREMKQRSERRKRERQEQESAMAERRAEEEAKRRADEEERRRKKEDEENTRREERAQKLADLDKYKNTSGRPNFVITKKSSGVPESTGDAEPGEEKKSKEQVEAEKQAILQQRIKPLSGVADMSTAELAEKAKELHDTIYRLESDRYSLEKRFRTQQVDMIDLAEKARKLNVVGKTVGLKRLTDDSDIMQEKFAGCPSKIEMYSRFERQKDKRAYDDRRTLYVGPRFGFAAEKIDPTRKVEFPEGGMPQYIDIPGAVKPEEAEEAAEEE